LEEVFRKYFGPEIVMQQNYLFNRTPFLDFAFIQVLFRSIYSGVYSKFMTGNPIKRLKGQLLYAYIIKNTFPPLLYFETGRNYKPVDAISAKGKLKLAKKYFIRRSYESDSYSVLQSFNNNKEKILGIRLFGDYYNTTHILNNVNNICDLDTLITSLSSNYYLSLNLQ